MFHAATIDSFDAIDSWSWKIMEFAKIWPLTCHNWVKYWPRTKNNTTNREYSARAICWSFPRSSTTLRLETPRGGSHQPPPLHRRRWRNAVYGRGLTSALLGIWVFHHDLLGGGGGCVHGHSVYLSFSWLQRKNNVRNVRKCSESRWKC